MGLAEPLRDALKPLSFAIQAASCGSVAKTADRSRSYIDLTVISYSVTYADIFTALERVANTVGRPINPTIYTVAEFSKRTRGENAFVMRVLDQPKVWIIGSEHDLPVAA